MAVRQAGDLTNGYGETVGAGAKCAAPLFDGEKIIGYLAWDNLLTHEPVTSLSSKVRVIFSYFPWEQLNHCQVLQQYACSN